MLALLALLSLHIYNYIAFLFLLISLLTVFTVPGIRREKGWSWIGWMFIPFVLGISGWLMNGTFEKTLNFIGMYGTIAVWPLLLGITSRFRDSRWEEGFFRIFIWATTVAVLFYNGQLVYRYFAMHQQFELLNQQHDFSFIYRTTFSKISGIHPTYFSLWTWIAVGIIGFRYRKQWKGFLVPLVVLMVGGLLLNSRMPLIAFVISFAPFAFRFLKKKQRLIWLGLFGVLIALFGLSRFSELKDAFNTNQLNSVNIRWQVWNCTTEITADGGLLGVGTGRGNEMLYDCYDQKGYVEAAEQHLNSHNMYLHFTMENGWIGGVIFLLFIIGLVYRFRVAQQSDFGVWLVVFFGLCLLTENLFHRQPAVVTFGLFVALTAFAKRTYSV